MDEDYAARLEAHLDHTNTRGLLTLAGLYLVAYELVVGTVVREVLGFMSSSWDDQGRVIEDADYRREVLAGANGRLDGSLKWLVRGDVLTEGQAETVRQLREARNRIAHELPKAVADPDFGIELQPLIDAAEVLKRLAVFFGGVSVATDPSFDHQEIDYEGIESGVSLLYGHVLGAFAALADESTTPTPTMPPTTPDGES